jgi:hypothetical protein
VSRSLTAVLRLVLIFTLTLVGLAGILTTVLAVGGLSGWTAWQFIGLFGVSEAAAGLANIWLPNVWHLPAEALERGDSVGLALPWRSRPHWAGAARLAAGVVMIIISGIESSFGPETLGLLPLVPALAVWLYATSSLVARLGVAYPEIDVLRLILRWRGETTQVPPISIGASALQLWISVAPLPAIQMLEPGSLFQPAIGPSAAALGLTLALAVVSSMAVVVAWRGRGSTAKTSAADEMAAKL